MCRRSTIIIPGLLQAKRKLSEEIARLSAEVESARKYKIALVVSWIFFFCYAMFTIFDF